MLRRIYEAHKKMDAACLGRDEAIHIMEVAGSHTVSGFRDGLRASIPKQVRLLSGPACPVGIVGQGFVETVIQLAANPDCIVAASQDLANVPGEEGSLSGRDLPNLRIVGSSDDAVRIAQEQRHKTIIYAAVGFETDAATTAVAIGDAERLHLNNFCVLSGHKRLIPALEALLAEKNRRIDAFICPEYISVIIGSDAYRPIVESFGKPCIIAALEPMHMIEGVAEACRQLKEGFPAIYCMSQSVVSAEGNTTAMRLIDEVFDAVDGYWRGLGYIPDSTLGINERYARFDALQRFGLDSKHGETATGCRCSEVLCGLIDSPQCDMFESECRPDSPQGPCMISSDGPCAAWYRWGRRRKRNTQ